MAKCNSLSIDVDGLMDELISTAVEAMKAVEDEALTIMAEEISEGSESRTKWRQEAIGLLKEVERNVTVESIEMVFGVDLASVSGDALNRIMVALYGNQGGGPIQSKPGADVYGHDMAGKHKSTAKSKYPIPQFDHPQSYNADAMWKNVFDLTKTMFFDAISSAWASVDFQKYVIVTGG